MKELLERWSAVEPERCHGNSVLIGGHFFNVALAVHGAPLVMEAAIQAIEARGWLWSISADWEDQMEPGVHLYTAEVKDESWIHGDPEYNPAAALLSAYLEAVEAAQAVEGGV